ncbi:MAG: 4Fe-4S dicluster domain-containing protein [Bacteroidales bacterium]
MQYLSIQKDGWDKAIEKMLVSYTIFATIKNDFGLDYEVVDPGNISRISYNKAKPATPLKAFFMPVSENVTAVRSAEKQRIILGVPNCDLKALRLLDEIYIDGGFDDIFYKKRRENTLLIASDCLEIQEHCHCTSYGFNNYATEDADLAVIQHNDLILLRIISARGDDFMRQFALAKPLEDSAILTEMEALRNKAASMLAGHSLPDFTSTGEAVIKAGGEIWKKYSEHCVSCGACTAVCPTCSCFLLIDKPGFEKVKHLDACQYPGFERVAGGEDSLFELPHRFRNRYMCKYSWKSVKFSSVACTGCGRCIEACIGKINKNELFLELAK